MKKPEDYDNTRGAFNYGISPDRREERVPALLGWNLNLVGRGPRYMLVTDTFKTLGESLRRTRDRSETAFLPGRGLVASSVRTLFARHVQYLCSAIL